MIWETVAACYLDGDELSGDVAIVMRVPAHLFPRRLVRLDRKMHGGEWPGFCAWGFTWSEQGRANTLMGDEPYSLVTSYAALPNEREICEFARDQVGEDAEEIPFQDLPGCAIDLLVYAMGKGQGYFFT